MYILIGKGGNAIDVASFLFTGNTHDIFYIDDVKKDERINKGNELYKMVTFYCNYGKIIYSKTERFIYLISIN